MNRNDRKSHRPRLLANGNVDPTGPVDMGDDPSIASLLLPNGEIKYPQSEEWRHLGRTVRACISEENRNARRVLPLRQAWAAAATIAIMFAVLIAVRTPQRAPEFADHSPGAMPEQQIAPNIQDTADERELADIRILVMQAELDALAVDIMDAGIDDGYGVEHYVEEVMQQYEIDPLRVFDSFVDAL